MTKDYLSLFWLSLIGMIVFGVILVLIALFCKKIIRSRKYGFIALACVSLLAVGISANKFRLCCKDYKYYANDTYVEVTGTVVDFMDVDRDDDGNGQMVYRKPKFYIAGQDEYIVLNTKDVELGETYVIRYYPNTKICDVVANTKSSS